MAIPIQIDCVNRIGGIRRLRAPSLEIVRDPFHPRGILSARASDQCLIRPVAGERVIGGCSVGHDALLCSTASNVRREVAEVALISRP